MGLFFCVNTATSVPRHAGVMVLITFVAVLIYVMFAVLLLLVVSCKCTINANNIGIKYCSVVWDISVHSIKTCLALSLMLYSDNTFIMRINNLFSKYPRWGLISKTINKL